jgi:hypothetical protein
MKRVASTVTATICAAVVFASMSNADPAPGNFVNVTTPSPSMRCGSAQMTAAEPVPTLFARRPVCQAPTDPVPGPGWHADPSVLQKDQAIITASGQFSWRKANLGLVRLGQPHTILVEGTTYHFEGWTIVPTGDGTTFTNDATGHGMSIDHNYNGTPF